MTPHWSDTDFPPELDRPRYPEGTLYAGSVVVGKVDEELEALRVPRSKAREGSRGRDGYERRVVVKGGICHHLAVPTILWPLTDDQGNEVAILITPENEVYTTAEFEERFGVKLPPRQWPLSLRASPKPISRKAEKEHKEIAA